MKLYGLLGEIIRFNKTDEDEQRYGPPPDYDAELEFDNETNLDVAAGLDGGLPGVLWQDHTLDSEGLKRSGIPLQINPPGTFYLDKQASREFWDDLGNGIDWLEAHRQTWQSLSDAWDGLTNAQKQTQLLNNFGVLLGDFATLLYINYRVLRFIRWIIKFLKLLVGL